LARASADGVSQYSTLSATAGHHVTPYNNGHVTTSLSNDYTSAYDRLHGALACSGFRQSRCHSNVSAHHQSFSTTRYEVFSTGWNAAPSIPPPRGRQLADAFQYQLPVPFDDVISARQRGVGYYGAAGAGGVQVYPHSANEVAWNHEYGGKNTAFGFGHVTCNSASSPTLAVYPTSSSAWEFPTEPSCGYRACAAEYQRMSAVRHVVSDVNSAQCSWTPPGLFDYVDDTMWTQGKFVSSMLDGL